MNGEAREIFKDPITDDGTKKSLKGYVAVYETPVGFRAQDQVSMEEVKDCAFNLVFKDGFVTRSQTLEDIRGRVRDLG